MNAQGEDVVAGIRTPQPINRASRARGQAQLPTLEEEMPRAYRELVRIAQRLEQHYRDMQDIEFTIQRGQALDAADAQRQAHRARRGEDRRRHGARRA